MRSEMTMMTDCDGVGALFRDLTSGTTTPYGCKKIIAAPEK
jgi:hypothetical protein